jgi:CBS domain-containing protein
MKMITINEFMTSDPVTLSETDTIDTARKLMTDKHIRHIPITDSSKHLRGLVTQRDILKATAPDSVSGDHDAGTQLSEIMVRNVSTINRANSLRQAAIYLQSHKYGCLPVVADGRLVGIITDSDFIDIAINLLEQAELAEEETGMDESNDDMDMPEIEEYL